MIVGMGATFLKCGRWACEHGPVEWGVCVLACGSGRVGLGLRKECEMRLGELTEMRALVVWRSVHVGAWGWVWRA